jgi:HTH-type transcriptional regulator/antitoxin HigA
MDNSIRAPKSDEEHAQMLRRIDSLWSLTDEASENELEVLSILVEAYERAHHEIPTPDPVAAIRFRMEQLGFSNADLGRVLHSRARATEILAGRRTLTLSMVRRLNKEMDIPADILIKEHTLTPRKTAKKTVKSSSKRSNTHLAHG